MVRAQQYRMFWRELAVLLEMGTTVSYSLKVICTQYSREDKFCSGIRKIALAVSHGVSLSQAMDESKLFSKTEVKVISAGEISGMLEIAVSRVANGDIPTQADQYLIFYKTFSGLMISGVPILTNLKLCIDKLEQPLKKAALRILDAVKEGRSIADEMIKCKVFSATEINIIDVGEQRNCTDSALMTLAKMSGPINFN